jgi:hypothetical protein
MEWLLILCLATDDGTCAHTGSVEMRQVTEAQCKAALELTFALKAWCMAPDGAVTRMKQ